ncbi:VRR-NUC domain-containing protein [Paraburkholderia kururiensis]|uniref:phosphodiesterase I n=2 Tax=Paraburkholderia kururiensis TaxID=984307 RepID=A0ABZ0WUU4_9BURK|nr:VRR-NUC domain-containing protein [Paraburkholderia kururiensis]WQD81159.1 VRR-NUC domain-containing protein [Paraburkholderia kururiensis]
MLERPSQALLTRMLMRQGPLFRTTRLRYDEIGCPVTAAQPLVALGWIDAQPLLAVDELAALLTRGELPSVAAGASGQNNGQEPPTAWPPPGHGRMTKAALVEALRHALPDREGDTRDTSIACPYRHWRPAADDHVFRLAVAPLCERLRLLFFGNLHQDWSEFVLADLGVMRYEAVPFDSTSRAFQTRADVDVYLALDALRDALESAHEPDALMALMEAAENCTSDNAWLHTRREKLLFAIGQQGERRRHWDLALQVYERCRYPGARYRRVRVLEALGRRGDALALAQHIATAPESEEEAQRNARTLARLQRSRVRRQNTGSGSPLVRDEIQVLAPERPTRVEDIACERLSSSDAPAFYVENTLINALFGLLCWRALFAPLPGAFFHPFQRGPADLHAPDFVARRAPLFAACLAELESGEYVQTIRAHFTMKAGMQSPFVAWGMLTPELLDLALRCFPAAHLRLWFERLLADLKTNRSGLPDLVRFWPAERRYALIEVKGPGDRLQDNQLRWLEYCAAHGMPVSVLHVRWEETAQMPAEAAPHSASTAWEPQP